MRDGLEVKFATVPEYIKLAGPEEVSGPEGSHAKSFNRAAR